MVKNAAAVANPALGSLPYRLSAKGLVVHSTAAGLTATDPTGEVVFSGPAPYVWDSSGYGSAVQPRGRVTAVGARIAGDQLSLVPDRAMPTAKTTRYPVYIDPSWSGVKQAWTQVWSIVGCAVQDPGQTSQSGVDIGDRLIGASAELVRSATQGWCLNESRTATETTVSSGTGTAVLRPRILNSGCGASTCRPTYDGEPSRILPSRLSRSSSGAARM